MENTDVTRKIEEFLKDFTFTSAADYVAAHPGSGSAHVFRPYGLPWYEVRNCLCAGQVGQVIMPPAKDGKQYVLRESFNYNHTDDTLAATISSALLNCREPVVLDEAVPLYPIWSLGNIWHWFFDSAPKVLAMEATGYTGPYIINTLNKVMREGLELLGVGPERMVHCGRPHLLRKAFVLAPLSWPGTVDKTNVLWAIRKRVLERTGTLEGGKRCFIRRIGKRRLANEEEFSDILARYDVEILVPEEHSLADQVRFMSNAALTLSPHGANSVLALFQKPESVLMEFFASDYINNICNVAIIKALQLLYIPITETVVSRTESGPQDEKREEKGDKRRDYHINTALVETVLDNVKNVRYDF